MKTIKRVLCRERLRQVPAQFSWVDQRLVSERFIERCDARALALYLFLITVADAQGLSYYGDTTLMQRLRLSPEALTGARQQLIAIELLLYRAPVYQVLALPCARPAPVAVAVATTATVDRDRSSAPVQLRQLLDQLGLRRDRL